MKSERLARWTKPLNPNVDTNVCFKGSKSACLVTAVVTGMMGASGDASLL